MSTSIEAGIHIGIYRNRPDVNVVVHTHQTFASVLAVIGKPIPVLYPALASGDEINKLPLAAIDYFADMRKSRFK